MVGRQIRVITPWSRLVACTRFVRLDASLPESKCIAGESGHTTSLTVVHHWAVVAESHQVGIGNRSAISYLRSLLEYVVGLSCCLSPGVEPAEKVECSDPAELGLAT
jgi:hypothetical protein